MTTTSYGFAGSLGAADYAKMARYAGSYGVAASGDWAVSAVSGQRAVSIAAGEIFGWNVRSVSTAAQTVNLPTPSAGQWFLIVATRDWGAKTTTPNYVAGATTSTTTPTAAPSSLPAINATPGTLDDQPLAWAWVNNTSTVVTIFDARTIDATTPVRGFRYPNLGALDVPTKLQHLATDIETAFTTAQSLANGTDLNTLTNSGVYIGTSLTNAPTGSAGTFYIEVLSRQGTTGVQRATSVDSSDLGTYTRQLVASTWTAWRSTIAVDTSETVGAFTAAAGWAIDSQSAVKLGRLAQVGIAYHRTGGSITVGSNGDIVNQTVATFRTGWSAFQTTPLASSGSGPLSAATAQAGTGLVLAAIQPNATTISNGDTFSAGGLYILAS